MTEPKRILVRPIGKAQPWAVKVGDAYFITWPKVDQVFYTAAEFAEMFDVVGEGEA